MRRRTDIVAATQFNGVMKKHDSTPADAGRKGLDDATREDEFATVDAQATGAAPLDATTLDAARAVQRHYEHQLEHRRAVASQAGA